VANETSNPKGIVVSRRSSAVVLVVSQTGKYKAVIEMQDAEDRKRAGVGKFDGNETIHEVPNKNEKLPSEFGILKADGFCHLCRNCSGPSRCLPLRVSVFRYSSTQHGQGTSSRMRVKGNHAGRKKKFEDRVIRYAAPTLEQIRKDRKEMLARPNRIPYRHKFLGTVDSIDVLPLCAEFDDLVELFRNFELEFKAAENRVSAGCNHDHPADVRACEKCLQDGIAAGGELRDQLQRVFNQGMQEYERNPYPERVPENTPRRNKVVKRVVDLPYIEQRILTLKKRYEVLNRQPESQSACVSTDASPSELAEVEEELRAYHRIIKSVIAPNPSPFSEMRRREALHLEIQRLKNETDPEEIS
jgi:hypothetical protein